MQVIATLLLLTAVALAQRFPYVGNRNNRAECNCLRGNYAVLLNEGRIAINGAESQCPDFDQAGYNQIQHKLSDMRNILQDKNTTCQGLRALNRENEELRELVLAFKNQDTNKVCRDVPDKSLARIKSAKDGARECNNCRRRL